MFDYIETSQSKQLVMFSFTVVLFRQKFGGMVAYISMVCMDFLKS